MEGVAGQGGRSCVGLKLAYAEAKITLIRLYQKYTLRLTPGQVNISCWPLRNWLGFDFVVAWFYDMCVYSICKGITFKGISFKLLVRSHMITSSFVTDNRRSLSS